MSTNAFGWQGAPSIFTTCKDHYLFNPHIAGRNQGVSERKKASPAELPGGSKHPGPVMMTKKSTKK